MKKSPILRYFIWFLIGAVVVGAFGLSIKVTEPNFGKLIANLYKAKQILPELLSPDLITRTSGTETYDLPFPIPCGSAQVTTPTFGSGVQLSADPTCADPGTNFTLTGKGFPGNADIRIGFLLPNGNVLEVIRFTTTSSGSFTQVMEARPIAAAVNGVTASVDVVVKLTGGVARPSQALIDVTNAILVTILMALLSTTLGTILAIPFAFLAARNITKKGVIGNAIYFLSRSVLNIIRSFEPLVMATIFALIVGFGSPFAGILGLVLVTTASLGKMFSEAIESIDLGPVEALTATGANRVEVLLYAVVPQVVPDFLSYIIYHWDINVRISTVIGFVGGGGIGYYLSQMINTTQFQKASTALLAIIIVVMILDFLSADIRKMFT
jgi:phosphonate transport system permease protein